MKKLLPTLFAALFIVNLNAQVHKCATDKVYGEYLNSDPNFKTRVQQNEIAVRNWINANKDSYKKQGSSIIYTIPVVFHVVYKNAAQNIADTNLFRQITTLNECYRKTNSNFSQTRPIFDTIGADVEIEFCLALNDPNGNPTNGITRKSSPSGAFDPIFNMDKVKSSATGGEDPWPTDKYLNIWVCDMSFLGVPFVLGYATFPGSDPLKDGVVIQYNFIGNQSNGTTNNLGRTTVHEVGHWLGMRHIWGDGQNSTPLCDSTDYVDDTPNADSASQQTCMIKNTCSNESPYWTNAGIDPPDMIENYMDYSYDACMTMFTQGQKLRMHGFLNTTRASLLTSPAGCNTIGLNQYTNEINFSIYPNPSNGILNINAKLEANKNYQYKITNLLGQTLVAENLKTNTINISELTAGIYLIELSSGNSKSVVKFIKEY